MQAPRRPLQAFRSVGAVVAGALIGIVLSIGTDMLLHLAGLMPSLGERASDSMLALATIYRTVYGVLGAYITARIAPYRGMQHVMVLGSFGFLASLIGAVATWNKGPAFGPHWYPAALIVLALPTAWLGGGCDFGNQARSRGCKSGRVLRSLLLHPPASTRNPS